MSKSAFEKWKAKNSVFGKCRFWEIVFNAGRLDGLEWALSKCQATKLAGDCDLTRIISEETIEAEIKRIKGS